jgi:hypothetical protein
MAEKLTTLFLAPDDTEPRIFDEADRKAVSATFTVIVDADYSFRRLERLKSKDELRSEAFSLCMMISANMDSIRDVKQTVEFLIADCHVERSRPLPKSVSALTREHGELLQLIGKRGGNDNLRARRVLRVLQLELIWFGQMW